MKVLRVSHSAVVDAWRDRERELRALGLDVHLVSARAWDEGGRRVRLEPRPDEPVAGVRTWGSHPALFVYDPVGLWRALRADWDVLDVHEEPYALATAEVVGLAWCCDRLSGRRRPYLVYTAQNIAKRHPWPFRRLERAVLRSAAAVVTCNAAAARIVRRRGLHGPAAVIPLGVDRKTFAPGPVRPVAPDDVVVGYAGRLTPAKGVDTLVDAAASERRLHLRIAGDGPERARLEERARRSGARVDLESALPTAALAGFYRSVDVIAVPSRTTDGWVEQFGRVAVEAMSCGVPVVVSDSGALPEVVGDAGVVVPEGDPRAWRDALLRVGADAELVRRLRASGFERADACSWARVAEQYAALYEEVGGAPAKPAPPEVLLVAYHTPELVRSALEPLAGTLAVTVVDNSSSPEVRDVCNELGVRYLDPTRNGGFAAGVNHGLADRLAPGADVLLLNPDARITLEGVNHLQAALHARPDLASVGPEQIDGSGRAARVEWPFLSPGRAWLDALGLGRLPHRRGYVIGSVLLLRAEALEAVGGLDERFFLYAEETDWAFRAGRLGWRHAVARDVQAVHLGGATSGDDDERTLHFHASQELYLRKHYGALGWNVARAAAVVGASGRTLVWHGEQRRVAWRRARLHWIGPAKVERDKFDRSAPARVATGSPE